MDSKTDRMLDVETLVAFYRCPNAGEIAYRRQNDVVDRVSFRIPNLSYVPIFDPAKLLQRIVELKAKLLVWAIVLLAEFATVLYIAAQGHPLFAILIGLAVTPALYYSYIDTEHLFKALTQREELQASLAQSLPETSELPVATHWWSLVKLGYIPIYANSYRDESTKLKGRPWRVLIHQESGERIPVVQHFEHFGNELNDQIATNSKALLAACARLIETHEPTTVRWGLVVDSRSLQAFLVPLDRQSIENTDQVARVAYDKLQSSRGKPLQLIEPPAGACHFCPLGNPRVTGRQTVIEGKRLRPNLYHLSDVVNWKRFFTLDSPTILNRGQYPTDDTDELFESEYFDRDDGDEDSQTEFADWLRRSKHQSQPRHCDCGDIFRWTPPHAYWKKRELNASLAYGKWLDRQNR